jgi:hypothetical protein
LRYSFFSNKYQLKPKTEKYKSNLKLAIGEHFSHSINFSAKIKINISSKKYLVQVIVIKLRPKNHVKMWGMNLISNSTMLNETKYHNI